MRRLVIAMVGAMMLAAGCGAGTTPASPTTAAEPNPVGDIPDNQVYVPFTPPGATFTVSVPEGWARTTDGGATVFSDKLNSVRVESVPRPAAPTTRTATDEDVPTLRSLPGYRAGSVNTVTRKAGDGVVITYQTTSTPDPVTGRTVTDSVERYEFWHGGKEVILTLTGPKGADNVDPWHTVTDSLRWQG